MAVLLANTTYRPALQRLVENGGMEGAQQDWAVLEGLRSVSITKQTAVGAATKAGLLCP